MDTPTPVAPRPAGPAVASAVRSSSSNLPLGLAAGAVAMLAGTTVWVVVTVVTNFQIGYLAVGVGYLVGLAIRNVGRGHDTSFRLSGAGLALLGTVLGNLFTMCYFVAQHNDMTFMAVVGKLTPGLAVDLLQDGFQPLDILFYILATMAGWRYSVR